MIPRDGLVFLNRFLCRVGREDEGGYLSSLHLNEWC